MEFRIKYRLYLGFIIVFILSAALSVMSYVSFRKQATINKWVTHSYEVLNVTQNIQKLLIDMETGRRGFRATNEKRFLQPYYESKRQINPVITKLKVLVADNPLQENKATVLEKATNDLLQFWMDKGEDASKYTREIITSITADEKMKMDSIRSDINKIIQEENELLAEREDDSNNSIKMASSISIIGIILIQAIILLLIAIIIREFRKNKMITARLEASNEELVAQQETLIESEKDLQNALGEVEIVNKQLEKFVYTVAHDIKSPLAGIIGILSILDFNEKVETDEELKEYSSLASSAAFHLSRMIDSLLEYSRVSITGQKVEELDTRLLIEQIVKVMFPPKNIRITISPDMPVIHANRLKIEQIFQNFISNAIKYNDKEKGAIDIGCNEKPECYEFFIRDNGQGIADDDLHKVFKLLNTGSNTSNRESSTGFGLNIVKLIVEEQGGKVWVESVPGQGSTFYFEWKK